MAATPRQPTVPLSRTAVGGSKSAVRTAELMPSAPIRTFTADWLAELGSTAPHQHARMLLAYLDGLLVDQIVRPDPDVDLRASVAVLLRGMLGDG